jgi:hypothetical protein
MTKTFLPEKPNLTGVGVTQGEFKTGIDSLIDYLDERFGRFEAFGGGKYSMDLNGAGIIKFTTTLDTDASYTHAYGGTEISAIVHVGMEGANFASSTLLIAIGTGGASYSSVINNVGLVSLDLDPGAGATKLAVMTGADKITLINRFAAARTFNVLILSARGGV